MNSHATVCMDSVYDDVDPSSRSTSRRLGPLLARASDCAVVDRLVPETAQQRGVRDALDRLRYLGVADSRDLELALAVSPLFVATWPGRNAECERFATDVVLVEGPGGDFEIRLAVFSGMDRMGEWLGDREASAWVLGAELCWALAMRLDCAGVAIDPGHGSQYCFSRSGLERLASKSMQADGQLGTLISLHVSANGTRAERFANDRATPALPRYGIHAPTVARRPEL